MVVEKCRGKNVGVIGRIEQGDRWGGRERSWLMGGWHGASGFFPVHCLAAFEEAEKALDDGDVHKYEIGGEF